MLQYIGNAFRFILLLMLWPDKWLCFFGEDRPHQLKIFQALQGIKEECRQNEGTNITAKEEKPKQIQ